MDLRRLRYFVAVAEELHIGRAARRLNMSQPPLTRQIQQLETEVGSTLFIRTKRGVEMTNAGKVLFEEARHLIVLAGRAEERTRLAGMGRSGRIDVGVFGSNLFAIPDLLLKFTRLCPDVDVVIHAMNKQEQFQALSDRRTAVGFNYLGLKLAGIASVKIRTEPVFIAIAENDPLASRDSIALREISDRPFIVSASGPRPNLIDFVFSLCLEAGFQPRVSQEVTDSLTAVALTAAGFGVSLVPAAAASVKLPNVVFKRIERSTPVTIDLHCIYRSDDTSPVLGEFLRTIR